LPKPWNSARPLRWLGLLGALILSVSTGAALLAHTHAVYSGACEKLTGFPSFLQAAGFIPTGNCKMLDHECPKGQECQVDGKWGHCVARQIDGARRCVCEPLKIGR